jgi:hypothetical protein
MTRNRPRPVRVTPLDPVAVVAGFHPTVRVMPQTLDFQERLRMRLASQSAQVATAVEVQWVVAP